MRVGAPADSSGLMSSMPCTRSGAYDAMPRAYGAPPPVVATTTFSSLSAAANSSTSPVRGGERGVQLAKTSVTLDETGPG